MRKYGTTILGESFDPGRIQKVWEKGVVVPGEDPARVRKDACGAWIHREKYGDRGSQWGWEIDHIKPVALGGADDLSNLQPLQWENNVHKDNDWPKWTCLVSAKTA